MILDVGCKLLVLRNSEQKGLHYKGDFCVRKIGFSCPAGFTVLMLVLTELLNIYSGYVDGEVRNPRKDTLERQSPLQRTM